MKTIKDQIESILTHCREMEKKSVDMREFKQSTASYILALHEYDNLSFLHTGLKYRKEVKDALTVMVTSAHPHLQNKAALREYLMTAAAINHQKTYHQLERKAKMKPHGHLAKALMAHTDFEDSAEATKPKKKTSIKRKASDRDDIQENNQPRKKSSHKLSHHKSSSGSVLRDIEKTYPPEVQSIWADIDATSESTKKHRVIINKLDGTQEEAVSIWESIDLFSSDESKLKSPHASRSDASKHITHKARGGKSQMNLLQENTEKNRFLSESVTRDRSGSDDSPASLSMQDPLEAGDQNKNRGLGNMFRRQKKQKTITSQNESLDRSSQSGSGSTTRSGKESGRRHRLFSHTRSNSSGTLKRSLERTAVSPKSPRK